MLKDESKRNQPRQADENATGQMNSNAIETMMWPEVDST
jgi:hypothetical protein